MRVIEGDRGPGDLEEVVGHKINRVNHEWTCGIDCSDEENRDTDEGD